MHISTSTPFQPLVLHAGFNNTSFNGTNGGRPMLLDGNIVLCSRSEAGGGGSFDGALTSLSLYDSFLNMTEVQELYNMVRSC